MLVAQFCSNLGDAILKLTVRIAERISRDAQKLPLSFRATIVWCQDSPLSNGPPASIPHVVSIRNLPEPNYSTLRQPNSKHLLKLSTLDSRRGVACCASAFCDDRKI